MLQTIILLLESLARVLFFLGFEKLETGVVHVDLTCLDVIGAEDTDTAAERGFVKVGCILVFLVEDQELCHDTINVDMEWMVGAPVMIKDLQRRCECFLSSLELS